MGKPSCYTRAWLSHLKDVVLIALVGVPFGVMMCGFCFDDLSELTLTVIISSTFWVVLSKGNQLLHIPLDRHFPWLEFPAKRFLIGLVVLLAYTTLSVLLMIKGFEYLFDMNFSNNRATIIVAILVTLIVTLFLNGRSFLLSWRRLELNQEKLKNENLYSRYETLKNQVNPHFLFNSLNALSNLVYEDQDLAAKFIKKLSEVYRYVLEQKDKEVVELSSEMEFVKNFVFLQKIRFGENLKVGWDAVNGSVAFVAPLSVQMLVENAIKHNTITEEQPLSVNLHLDEDNYLVVENNLQPKNIGREDSSQLGLENIKARYAYLTNRPVEVDVSDHSFVVKLPILEFKHEK